MTPNALTFSPPVSNYLMLSDGRRPSELRTIPVNFEAQGTTDGNVTYGLKLRCKLCGRNIAHAKHAVPLNFLMYARASIKTIRLSKSLVIHEMLAVTQSTSHFLLIKLKDEDTVKKLRPMKCGGVPTGQRERDKEADFPNSPELVEGL
ncbi:hypothetical protein F4604DRAFT_1686733 [Suillus subluteus]|nr:hypothetical protein F4604DRAFT_1686733 [Suillus subluteus]